MDILYLLLIISVNSVVGKPLVFDTPVVQPLETFKPWGLNLKSLDCFACTVAVKEVDNLIKENATKEEVAKLATDICKLLKIESDRVCDYVVKEFVPEIFGVAVGAVITPDEVCSRLLGNSCGNPYDPGSVWNVTFPDVPKPPVIPPKPPKDGSPTLRILHLTDLHYDRRYKAGSNAECGEPLCCRDNDGPPAEGVAGAGLWGDYRYCDTPKWLIINLLEHLSKNEKFDAIYLTGDLPAHNVWNQTREDEIEILNEITAMLLKYFPKTRIFPSVGNHESAPVNSFPPPYVTGKEAISWLYDAFTKAWIDTAHWLPEDTRPTIKQGGYYATEFYPGLLVVSLNMNMCNTENWWLLINETDPAGELQWLISTLQQAENKNQKVHILGHIAPGSGDCLKWWSWNYYKIVNRYESTITGQYFGHTHIQSLEVMYDLTNTSRPLNVVHMPGSVTTYKHLNPGYRVCLMDGNYNGSSWMMLDYNNTILNLTDANLTNKPVWQFAYNPKVEYGMKNLFPEDWNDFVQRMKTDRPLFDKFRKHLYKSNEHGSCDESCRAGMICSLESGRSNDDSFCKDADVEFYKAVTLC
ncbi:sphingomyelin phosphodiesterase-like [Anneissia japonica]|uniref:sphingomyelin phosphodiesterase-like n=1 Tax=Anneissia japonica TaxID=1529436 RepID=UPI00142550E1|nr:sphingomyelin phosphodiesterase-like [Anneissia japonica]